MNNLTLKWKPVLESDIGPKLETMEESDIMAVLLENGAKLNKAYLPESVNVTSDVKRFQDYTLPMIRRYFFSGIIPKLVSIFTTATPAGTYEFSRYNNISGRFNKIEGAVLVGTRAIDCPELTDIYNSGINRDLNFSDFDGTMKRYNTTIDHEIVSAMKHLAISNYMAPGTYKEKLAANGLIDNLFYKADRIISNTKMIKTELTSDTKIPDGILFAICSPRASDLIAKSPDFKENKNIKDLSRYIEFGSITKDDKTIHIIKDTVHGDDELFTLVGIKGIEGKSGVGFMPYLPFIFSKKISGNTGFPEVIIKARYAIIANIENSAAFYEYDTYVENNNTDRSNIEFYSHDLTINEGLVLLSTETLVNMRDGIKKTSNKNKIDDIWLDKIDTELKSRDKIDSTFNDM